MSQSESEYSKIVFDDKDNKKSSILTVFKRSAIYEGKFLLNNSWDYVMLIWLPLLTILAIWWIFSKPYIVDLPIGVVDNSQSSYSRTLTRFLNASPDLAVSKIYPSTAQAKEDIIDNDIYAVVIIPHEFADNINQSKPSPVVLQVNAQYGTHSGIIQKGVQTVVGTLSAGIEIQQKIKRGVNDQQAKTTYSPISVERVSLFNIGANYQQFLASTVIPAILHILAMIIGATTIGREIRDKTLSMWYHNMVYPDMPYPNFKTLKNIPPEHKLEFLHADLHASWHNPDVYSWMSKLQYRYTGNNVIGTNLNNLKNLADNNQTNYNQVIKPRMPKKVSILSLIVGLNGKLIWALLFYALWGALAIMLATQAHSASLLSILLVFLAFMALTMISLWLGAIFSLTTYSLRMGLSGTAFVSAPSFAFAGVTFPLLAMSEGAQKWANSLPLTHYLKVHLTQLQMLAPPSIAFPTLIGLYIAVLVTLVITALLSLRAFKNPERWGAR